MDIRELFIKHAQGTCTAEEKALLVAWLQENEDAAALPDPEELMAVTSLPVLETAAAERILENILETPVLPVRRNYRPLMIRWVAAAAVVLGLAASTLWWYRPHAQWVNVRTPYAQMRTIHLPDGSTIHLNANSQLKYDSNMQRSSVREVWLQGEAFFEIAPAAAQFTVHAGQGLEVAVLGTRFNITHNDSSIQVVLNSGRVSVKAANNSPMLLLPGEMAVYRGGAQNLQKQAADTLVLTGWKDHVLTFHQTSLQEIAGLIQRHFGVQVVFTAPELSRLQFTGTAPAGNLELLLSILERSLDIRVNKTNGQVVIRPAH
ncbi:FecR family protein [Chitinophaga sp. GbtcB8]|uniref:FecR family protein n=1 Tax=Chitinophaga sp. GbtcB8 TaxID=2824753 RepID=UPI001C2FC658|nr:FecR domain-containing protein [Chitinophaga sp. GbtcB8]